jgi:hypothetical protein
VKSEKLNAMLEDLIFAKIVFGVKGMFTRGKNIPCENSPAENFFIHEKISKPIK